MGENCCVQPLMIRKNPRVRKVSSNGAKKEDKRSPDDATYVDEFLETLLLLCMLYVNHT